MESLLNVENLSVSYSSFELSKISFCCNPGEVLGIIGINGAGKSTTIKAIMQIIPRGEGGIYWKGEAVTVKKIPEFREQVGYVGDNDCYYPNIKVKKILKFVSSLYRNWDNEAVEKYVRTFQIDTNKKMKELSTGMRVKLDLLMAMSHNAQIYILDEPTSGLDPVIRKELLDILYNLAKHENKAVIISSHITSDLEKIAERVMYIVSGKIAIDDKVSSIQQKYIKVYTKGMKSTWDMKGCIAIDEYIIMPREIFSSHACKEDNIKVETPLLEDVLFYLGEEAEK